MNRAAAMRATSKGARATRHPATMPISRRRHGRRAIPRTIAMDHRASRPSVIRRVRTSRRQPRARCLGASVNCRARGRPRRGTRRSSARRHTSRGTPSRDSFRRHPPPRHRRPRQKRRRLPMRSRQTRTRSRRRVTPVIRPSHMPIMTIGPRIRHRRRSGLWPSRRLLPRHRRARPRLRSRAARAVPRKASPARAGRRAAASRLIRRNQAPARHHPNPVTLPDRPRSRAGLIGIATCKSPASMAGLTRPLRPPFLRTPPASLDCRVEPGNDWGGA